MNRRQLIATAAKRTTLTRAQVGEALDAVLSIIGDTLAAGEEVSLRDFGYFSTDYYRGRQLSRFGRPGHYRAEAHALARWKPAEALRRKLREK